MKKITLIFFAVIICGLTIKIDAQKKIIIKSSSGLENKTISTQITQKPDTLNLNKIVKEYNTIFNLEGQDIISAWFVCPVDLTIKAVGIDCGENISSVNSEIKIVKMNKVWTEAKLKAIGSENLGYWINNSNPNIILPYAQDAADPKQWISNTVGSTSPFDEDLWSNGGQGVSIVLENDADTRTYQWVTMNSLNYEPSLKKGEIFAVSIKNMEPKESNKTLGIIATNELDYGAFKFYAKGRTKGDLTTAGWWKRDYLLNVAVSVEITGDVAPVITDVLELSTTLSTGSMEVTAKVTDQNPSGGPSGINKSLLQYFINTDTTWKEVSMTKTAGDTYSGKIPGQSPGAKISYRIKAIDVNGNISYSEKWYTYFVFAPTPGVKSLLVFNGVDYNKINQSPLNQYFLTNDSQTSYQWQHDTWAYGALTDELVNNYTNIFEITNSSTSGNIIYNDQVIRKWLNGNGYRNYALAGQEWLGARNGFIDRDFYAGTFEYDILGISHSYSDVADTANSKKPSRLFALKGSLLTDELFSRFSAWGTDSLQYDPYYELNKVENWIDGFEVLRGQQTDMQVETNMIEGKKNAKNVSCLTHRLLNGWNKIAFFSFDPLAINTKSPSSNSKYYKFGTSSVSPQIKVLQWFNILVSVEESVEVPSGYNLSQNYPNPFNPSTVISYQLPITGHVALKIYDVLGREVATLVNEEKSPGNYEVKFNAETFHGASLPSGVYFYRLQAGSFLQTKKLVLMK